jgi:hypothetical protein
VLQNQYRKLQNQRIYPEVKGPEKSRKTEIILKNRNLRLKTPEIPNLRPRIPKPRNLTLYLRGSADWAEPSSKLLLVCLRCCFLRICTKSCRFDQAGWSEPRRSPKLRFFFERAGSAVGCCGSVGLTGDGDTCRIYPITSEIRDRRRSSAAPSSRSPMAEVGAGFGTAEVMGRVVGGLHRRRRGSGGGGSATP